MKQSTQHCPKCGVEITDKKCKKCPNCGVKISKPIHKKWWFWAIIVIVCISLAPGTGDDSETNDSGTSSSAAESTSYASANTTEIVYEEVDLKKMLDDLKENALRAEKSYQNKYIIVTGKISNFDSDGSYISIEPVDADSWNFDSVTCYIKNESQLDFLLTKSVGDTVTIKGKIKSIGEVIGYSLNIDEIE